MKSHFSFNKAIRLRTRRHYQRMANFDTRQVGRYLIFDLKYNHLELSRLGITVSKRFGKAVKRNRFKRIVREAFRLTRHYLRPGLDINVKPRSAALQATSSDIKEEFLYYLK